MSSRNAYLSDGDRAKATELVNALRDLSQRFRSSPARLPELETQAVNELNVKGWAVDYLTIRRRSDLLAPNAADQSLVALGAAKLANTRLIDNVEF